jgi:glycosyltransferase involved in cell wall biosynthesis
LANTVYDYYLQNGLWRTLIRAAERVTGRQLAVPRAPNYDGVASDWVDRSVGVPSGDAVLVLEPGANTLQNIETPLDAVIAAWIGLDVTTDFDCGVIGLLSGGMHLYSEPVRKRRIRSGRYALDLPFSGIAAKGAPLVLWVAHKGRRGAIRVRTNTLRIAGRAPHGIARYPRALQLLRPADHADGQFEIHACGLAQPGTTAEALYAIDRSRAARPVLLLGREAKSEEARSVVRAAQARLVPVVGMVDAAAGGHSRALPETQLLQWSDVLAAAASAPAELERCWKAYLQRALPKISVVTAFRDCAPWLPAVLESYQRQVYEGETEFIFVDDASVDGSAELVVRWASELAGTSFAYRLERNAAAHGASAARNAGIACASGEVIVLMDGRHVMGDGFIRAHAQAHSFGDCHAVTGPVVRVSEAGDARLRRDELQLRPGRMAELAAFRDRKNLTSFLNTSCGNFSVRRAALDEPLCDEQFADCEWADIEMGYRLYRRGLRVKYTSDALSVGAGGNGAAGGERRFHEKHPEAAAEAGHPQGRLSRRLRVLTYRWHVAHQYELYKLGHEFSLVGDLESRFTNGWDFHLRPLPANARFISRHAIDERHFDLAILHFDENVLSPENTGGVLGPEWGAAFRFFMEKVLLPKVAICHGTPQFHGQYNPNYARADLLQTIEPARRKLVDYLGDTLVICNSHQAQAEWGFRRSRVIWHGFDPTEFPPATHEHGILSPLGPLVMSRPHYRGYFLYKKVFADFPAEHAPSTLFVPDPSPLYSGNQLAKWKYRNYIDEIRRYSVYFNPTQRSPMPRSRGEPMMCGVVTVSAKNHDVDMFIRSGQNGFYSDDPQELREQLLFLCRNPLAARRIGAEGRRTALEVFHIDRYLADWRDVIRTIA